MSVKFYKREELEGRLVVNQDAQIVGKVEDLAITQEGQVGISVKNEEGDEMLLRLDDIQKIADVILLKAEDDETKLKTEPSTPEPEPEQEKIEEPPKNNICSNCGWENRPDVKYCVKCGTKLG